MLSSKSMILKPSLPRHGSQSSKRRGGLVSTEGPCAKSSKCRRVVERESLQQGNKNISGLDSSFISKTFIFLEIGSCCVAQAGLELTTFSFGTSAIGPKPYLIPL